MAYKTVLTAAAREQIRRILNDVAAEKGSLYFAMLTQTIPEVSDRWTLIVSAPWVDSSGARTIVSYLSSRLGEQLSKNALAHIDRIVPVSRTDPLVERMLTLRPRSLADPVRHFVNWRAGEIFMPEGYIFAVDPDAGTRRMVPSAANGKTAAP